MSQNNSNDDESENLNALCDVTRISSNLQDNQCFHEVAVAVIHNNGSDDNEDDNHDKNDDDDDDQECNDNLCISLNDVSTILTKPSKANRHSLMVSCRDFLDTDNEESVKRRKSLSNADISPFEETDCRIQQKVDGGRKLSTNERNKLKSKLKIWDKLLEINKTSKPKSLQQDIEDLYFETISDGSTVEVEALLSISDDDERYQFNRNATNLEGKTALVVAIDNRDKRMLQLLLNKQIQLGDSLYYAIRENYVKGVKLILDVDSCVTSCVKPENHEFQIGLTPFSLAAITNNYSMLKILERYGHSLKETLEWKDNFHQAWEFRAIRKINWMARASPAYITWKCEKFLENQINKNQEDNNSFQSNWNLNVIGHGMDLIKSLRERTKTESELASFYKGLCDQVEEFLCELLDQVQSTLELSLLFDYDYLQLPQHNYSLFVENSTKKTSIRIIEKACELKMYKFVNHTNSQLTISYLLYRNTPFLRNVSYWKRFFIRTIIGMLFPMWVIFHLFAPRSKFGKILKFPSISYECYTMSCVLFLLLLIVNVATKKAEHEYLGAPPTVCEIIIAVWVLGKWKEEYIELKNRGFRSYLRDWWNYNDLIQLCFYTASFILRMIDYGIHKDDAVKIYVENWPPYDLRPISTGLLACFYVMAFIRILRLTRTNRVLGPLQITLAKMLNDVVRFFVIFALVMFAFGIGLSELYWYFGTEQGARLMCSPSENATAACIKMSFTSIPNTMVNLFWGLFGHLELEQLEKTPSPVFIKLIGYILLGAYSVTVIIIMLNMLIAMMSKSFEAISGNEEKEWRFYRAVIWIRFIRGDFACPPPLNLIPNVYSICHKIKRYVQQKLEQTPSQTLGNHKITVDFVETSMTRTASQPKEEFTDIQQELIKRYKFVKLLENRKTK